MLDTVSNEKQIRQFNKENFPFGDDAKLGDQIKQSRFLAQIRADLYRYTGSEKPGFSRIFFVLYHHVSIVHLFLYRLIEELQKTGPVGGILAVPFKLILHILGHLIGIHLDLSSNIGEGFYIGHFGGIFIGPIRAGRCCNVNQGVTLGQGARGTEKFGVPTLGDYVWIGPGAVVSGNVKIGNNVCIGANSVVSKDIPDNAIVVGNPGRIIGYQQPDEHTYLDNVYPPEPVAVEADAEALRAKMEAH